MALVLPDRFERVASVMTLTSPLIHTDERVEVMQRFRREPFLIDGELVDIPVYSGNAVRGMLRRAAALRLADLIEVEQRSLPVSSFYLLFSGGYLEGSDHSHRTAELQAFRDLLPILGLFGGSWGSRILHGLLDVRRAVPECAQLAGTPGHEDYTDAPSVFDMLTELSFSRKDDRPDGADDRDEKARPQQMRYSFEALIPGTRLRHGLVIRTSDELMIGCLADAVQVATDWDTLGGRAAIGHGRFTWTLTEWAEGHREEVAAYHAHTMDHALEIREALGIIGLGV